MEWIICKEHGKAELHGKAGLHNIIIVQMEDHWYIQSHPSYQDLSGHWIHIRMIGGLDDMIWDPQTPLKNNNIEIK